MRLSKSRFTAGLQCHKRLYLQVHQPELAAEPDESTQARFDQGIEVGRFAADYSRRACWSKTTTPTSE